jgi:hypothetical protein
MLATRFVALAGLEKVVPFAETLSATFPKRPDVPTAVEPHATTMLLLGPTATAGCPCSSDTGSTPGKLKVAPPSTDLPKNTPTPLFRLLAGPDQTISTSPLGPEAIEAVVELLSGVKTKPLLTTIKGAALLVIPAAEAVMFVVPIAAPVARPALVIVAVLVSLDAQVNGTPLTVLPLASRAVPLNWDAWPMILASEAGEIAIFANCGVTVSTAVPDLPELLAVMLVVPAATPVALPLAGSNVATAVLLDNHAKIAPGIAFPLASLATAENCCVLPIKILAGLGETVTETTGTATMVTVREADLEVSATLVAWMETVGGVGTDEGAV